MRHATTGRGRWRLPMRRARNGPRRGFVTSFGGRPVFFVVAAPSDRRRLALHEVLHVFGRRFLTLFGGGQLTVGVASSPQPTTANANAAAETTAPTRRGPRTAENLLVIRRPPLINLINRNKNSFTRNQAPKRDDTVNRRRSLRAAGSRHRQSAVRTICRARVHARK